VTFVPIALTVADYLARQVHAAAEGVPALAWLLRWVGWLEPVVVGVLLLSSVYVLMPNTRVQWRSALGGAAVAVLLWVLAKWGFATYVTQIVKHRSLYGALGLVPLFLIWVNLCWLIFLFGAELAYTAANLERLRSAEAADRIVLGPWDLLAASLAVVEPYLAGRGAATREHVVARLRLPEEPVHRLLGRLAGAGIICEVAGDSEAYVPARPAERIAVREIMAMDASAGEAASASRYDERMSRTIASVRGRADAALESVTLADVAAGSQGISNDEVRMTNQCPNDE
jgi:membrane protein